MEIFPLHVCRHVLKFILDRQITWFDLAFYDPAIFDSLRSIVFNEADNVTHSNEFYESLQLTFAVDMPPEEVRQFCVSLLETFCTHSGGMLLVVFVRVRCFAVDCSS